jgi:hypothetical protein
MRQAAPEDTPNVLNRFPADGLRDNQSGVPDPYIPIKTLPGRPLAQTLHPRGTGIVCSERKKSAVAFVDLQITEVLVSVVAHKPHATLTWDPSRAADMLVERLMRLARYPRGCPLSSK